jgi:hypothetical protein
VRAEQASAMNGCRKGEIRKYSRADMSDRSEWHLIEEATARMQHADDLCNKILAITLPWIAIFRIDLIHPHRDRSDQIE